MDATTRKVRDLMQRRLSEVMRTQELVLEEKRLASFENDVAKSSLQVPPRKLAEAGFFYVPCRESRDTVKCAFCGLELESWRRHDDPWSEHRNHTEPRETRKRLDCPFLSLGKRQKDMTVKEFRDLMQGRFNLMLATLREEIEDFIEKEAEASDVSEEEASS